MITAILCVQSIVSTVVWWQIDRAMFSSSEKIRVPSLWFICGMSITSFVSSLGSIRPILPLICTATATLLLKIKGKRSLVQAMTESIATFVLSRIITFCALITTMAIASIFTIDYDGVLVRMVSTAPGIIFAHSIQKRLSKVNWEVLTEKMAVSIVTAGFALFMASYSIMRMDYLKDNRLLCIFAVYSIIALLAISALSAAIIHKQQSEVCEYKRQINVLRRSAHKFKEIIPAIERELNAIKEWCIKTSNMKLHEELLDALSEVETLRHDSARESHSEFIANQQFSSTGLRILDSQLLDEQQRASADGINFQCVITTPADMLIKQGVLTQFKLQQVVGDLYRNAVQAINCTDGATKEILLVMGLTKTGYQIKMCDSGEPFMQCVLDKLGQRGVSTSESGHGIADILESITPSGGSFRIFENDQENSNFSKRVEITFDGEGAYEIHTKRDNAIQSNSYV